MRTPLYGAGLAHDRTLRGLSAQASADGIKLASLSTTFVGMATSSAVPTTALAGDHSLASPVRVAGGCSQR